MLLKYLSNFGKTLKIPLTNCEINLMLNWSGITTNSTDAGSFTITNTKFYVAVVTLSTENNAKLLKNKTRIRIQRNNSL